MKKIILAIMFLLICSGCSTIGNGVLDPIESGTIRLAVGAAMTSEPKLVIPAYAVSTALLVILDGTETSTLGMIETALEAEVKKLNLVQAEREIFMDLVAVVKADIEKRINLPGIEAEQKIVVIRSIIQIVRDAAYARISM